MEIPALRLCRGSLEPPHRIAPGPYAFDNQSRRVSHGREQYREIAEKLYQLGERTDLPGAMETQKAILFHLAEEMHRFPAFLEELQKRFPDLVEIPKQ